MKKFLYFVPVLTLVGLIPSFAHAATTLQDLLFVIKDILAIVIPILVTIAVIVFIWGVIQYVLVSGEEAKKEGRDKIIYGLLGLFVIVAVWGLVRVLIDTFGITDTGVSTPCIPGEPC